MVDPLGYFWLTCTSYIELHVSLDFGVLGGVRCSSVVRAFAHGAMGCRIDPLWGGPIELFLVDLY